MKRLLILSFIFQSTFLFAEQSPYYPKNPDAWVNDYAGVFDDNELYFLNKKFATYEDSTSTQIFLVTMNEHGDIPIAMMGAEIGENWSIGQKGMNNGLLILMYFHDREISIQTGYGLEEFIPDAIAKRIIEKEIKPHFRNNDYLTGIDAGTDVIFGLLSGKFTAEEYRQESGSAGGGFAGIFFLFIMFFLFFGQSRRRRYSSVGRNIPFWLALSMLSGTRSSHSGSWGGFSSGSGSFGGFSGGGGGSFGGGGASGSW